MQYEISAYFECRMENRNVRDQAKQEEEEMMNEEWIVADEWKEEAPSASAGNGLFQFYYSLINKDVCKFIAYNNITILYY